METHPERTVAVFGIFDGVHEGHRALFAQAREMGTRLVAIVGRDSSCAEMKKKLPAFPQEKRLALVAQEKGVDEAVLGDEKSSSYLVLERLNPAIVCLGYDQEALWQDLAAWIRRTGAPLEIRRARAWRPDVFHTSLLRKP